MNITITSLDVQTKTFEAELDAGPGFDAALTALNLDPNFGYTIDVQGDLRIVAADDGATVELDGDAYLVHPTTKATVSFSIANLDTAILEEALYEAGYNNSDVYQEFCEMQYAACEAAWESYNDR